MTPVAFTVRAEKVDEQLLDAAQRRGSTFSSLVEVEQGGMRPLLLEHIVTPSSEGGAPSHFGKTTTLLWRWAYELFVGGASVVAHPSGFDAKSVLAVDVFHKPMPWDGTAYLGVWASGGPSVLIPFPRVAPVLMTWEADKTFAEGCGAYRELVAEAVARVNLVAPAALALAEQEQVS